ncbi:hypothetical protein RvY_04556 [Ramazzottius varieornatus]|uniref:RHD domain-containing protein n=1 Tax=Ramazzottius varieornatus TaxID=947166 RepID=A0A1D1UVC9_RAMVA|nr:hypothetical protein RvY_04556 [Ramazzottius varieornatus]
MESAASASNRLPVDPASRGGVIVPANKDVPSTICHLIHEAISTSVMTTPFPPSKGKSHPVDASPLKKAAPRSFCTDAVPTVVRYQADLPVPCPIGSPRTNGLGPRQTENAADLGIFSKMSIPPLTDALPSRHGNLELVINRQPRSYHRARYEKEGSRGSIKDATGNSCPAIRLKGLKGTKGATSILHVFVAAKSDPIGPHPLYRIHAVFGKNCIPCDERQIDGIPVVEVPIRNDNDGVVNLNCMGITKLRNADLETAPGARKISRRNVPDSSVRLVFRAITSVRGRDGFCQTTILQTCSDPICCTSLPGVPEVLQLSHEQWPVTGGLRIIILGRNFIKDECRAIVQETKGKGDETVIWQHELFIQRENFLTVHLVALMVPYVKLLITRPVQCQLIIQQKGQTSEPYYFTYIPSVQPLWPPPQIQPSPLLRRALCTSYSACSSPTDEPALEHSLGSMGSSSSAYTPFSQTSNEDVQDAYPVPRHCLHEPSPSWNNTLEVDHSSAVVTNVSGRRDLLALHTEQPQALHHSFPGAGQHQIAGKKRNHPEHDEVSWPLPPRDGTLSSAIDDITVDEYLASLGSEEMMNAANALFAEVFDEIMNCP